jgi:23S rRNA G2445 N2-methylase RlmL
VEIIVTCPRGAQTALRHELLALGAGEVREDGLAMRCEGDESLLCRLNVQLRTASRVLMVLQRFQNVSGEEDLVSALMSVPFEERLNERGTFCVDTQLHYCPMTNSHYAALRVKDCILDRLRDRGMGRPNVDVKLPSLRYVLSWRGTAVTLALDTSGAPLHERGYRDGVEGEAPLRETTAAAMLAMGHAPAERPFLDPCCGTGTLAIEQAWRALKRAPHRDRRFGFERWSGRPASLDRALANARNEARDLELNALPAPILLSDWHPKAIAAAEQCIAQAGLQAHLKVQRCDARDAIAAHPTDGFVVAANLPFGERLGGKVLQLQGFYRTFGDALRARPGTRAILLTAQEQAVAWLGLTDPRIRKWALPSPPLSSVLYRWDIAAAKTNNDDNTQA